MRLLKFFFKCFLILALIWLGGFAVFVGNALFSEPKSPSLKTDGVVVFTGHPKRVQQGLMIHAQGLADQVLISGVHENTTPSGLRNTWHKSPPLPDCCIELGRAAKDTVGNAIETATWVKEHDISSLRLVTSNYHMPRAMMELRHSAPTLEIIPHPVKHEDRTYKDRAFWEITFVEYHKTLFRFYVLAILSKQEAADAAKDAGS